MRKIFTCSGLGNYQAINLFLTFTYCTVLHCLLTLNYQCIYISTSEYSTFAVEELPNYSKSYIGTASPALQGPDNDNYAEKK